MSDVEQLLGNQGAFLFGDNTNQSSALRYAHTLIEHYQYRIAHYRHKQMVQEAQILEEELNVLMARVEQWEHERGSEA